MRFRQQKAILRPSKRIGGAVQEVQRHHGTSIRALYAAYEESQLNECFCPTITKFRSEVSVGLFQLASG